MARYSIGLASTVSTDNVACWGFLAQSDENPVITELSIYNGAATASRYGFGRAATAGTQTSGVSVLPNASGDATTGVSTCAVAWSVAPTVPTQYLRRVDLGGVIGDTVLMVFPYGIKVASSGEMVLWNIAGTTNSAKIFVNVESEE